MKPIIYKKYKRAIIWQYDTYKECKRSAINPYIPYSNKTQKQ